MDLIFNSPTFSIWQEGEWLYVLSPCCTARLEYNGEADCYRCDNCDGLFNKLTCEDHPKASTTPGFEEWIKLGAYVDPTCNVIESEDTDWWASKWLGQTVKVHVS